MLYNHYTIIIQLLSIEIMNKFITNNKRNITNINLYNRRVNNGRIYNSIKSLQNFKWKNIDYIYITRLIRYASIF